MGRGLTSAAGPLPTHSGNRSGPLPAKVAHSTGAGNHQNFSSALNASAVIPASRNAVSVTDPSRLA